jgi:glycosyltransferase involved in cell wall biosynthesis
VTVVSPAHGDLRNWVEEGGAKWVQADLRRAPSKADFGATRAIRKLYRETDVVHLHSSKGGAVGRLATIGLKKPPRIIFNPHAWGWYVGGKLGPAYKLFERWAATRSDLIVAVSKNEFTDGRKVLGPSAPLELIENGVDLDSFTPLGQHASRTEDPLLVVVGRLCEQKGQDRLIRAIARPALSAVRLRIVGAGPDELALRNLAAALAVTDRVDFVGACDPRPHLRAADLVVLPSRWEGMSLGMLEALACGCAIVATHCGGTDALIGAGIVVGPGTESAVLDGLTHELVRLLGDPAEINRLRGLARTRAVECFDLADVESRYLAAWTTGVEPSITKSSAALSA